MKSLGFQVTIKTNGWIYIITSCKTLRVLIIIEIGEKTLYSWWWKPREINLMYDLSGDKNTAAT